MFRPPLVASFQEVLSFKAPAKLVEHVSPVGNSSVPYPYAVDADGRHYLFIEKVVLDQIPTDAEHPDDPDPPLGSDGVFHHREPVAGPVSSYCAFHW